MEYLSLGITLVMQGRVSLNCLISLKFISFSNRSSYKRASRWATALVEPPRARLYFFVLQLWKKSGFYSEILLDFEADDSNIYIKNNRVGQRVIKSIITLVKCFFKLRILYKQL